MAGSWIKMRAALRDKPEVIRMTKSLQENKAFREWITPGGSGHANGQIVCYAALRTVTCGLLLSVWSNARENGKFVGDDLVLEGLDIEDLDEMAGAPGVGDAMRRVGWALRKNGVTLPRFKTYNVPMDAAERQAMYRERRYAELRNSNGSVSTKPLPERETEGDKKNPPKAPPRGGRTRPLTSEQAQAAILNGVKHGTK